MALPANFRCNRCWEVIDAPKAWLTSCWHIFCDKDAAWFDSSNQCMSCDTQLAGQYDLREVSVEAPSEDLLLGLSPNQSQSCQKRTKTRDAVSELSKRAALFYTYQKEQEERWWVHKLQRADKKKEEAEAEFNRLHIEYRKQASVLELQLEDACKRGDALQRDVARLTDEWMGEKQKHARTKQSYQKVMEQHNQSAVARLQPARINPLPLSPMPSPASAPTNAIHPTPRDGAAGHYGGAHTQPPHAASVSPGWGSSSHGSMEYGKDVDNRTAQHTAAVVAAYQPHAAAAMMPTQLPGAQNVDSRRRQLPMYVSSPPVRSTMPVVATEQQRYQRERQVHHSAVGGPSGGRQQQQQQQHAHGQQKSTKKRTYAASPLFNKPAKAPRR